MVEAIRDQKATGESLDFDRHVFTDGFQWLSRSDFNSKALRKMTDAEMGSRLIEAIREGNAISIGAMIAMAGARDAMLRKWGPI